MSGHKENNTNQPCAGGSRVCSLPNRTAMLSLLLGLGANAAGVVYICSGGLTFYLEERYVLGTLFQSLVLALFCLATAIAAIRLGRSALRGTQLLRTAGHASATAGVALGIFSLLWMPIMLLAILDVGREIRALGPRSVSRLRCTERLLAIGNACAQYASANNGRFPDAFIKLHTECGLDTRMLLCGRISYPRMPSPSAQQITELIQANHLDTYVYVGAGLESSAGSDTVLAYEHLRNHNWGIHVLYADGRVEWLNEERARQLIAAMEAGTQDAVDPSR